MTSFNENKKQDVSIISHSPYTISSTAAPYTAVPDIPSFMPGVTGDPFAKPVTIKSKSKTYITDNSKNTTIVRLSNITSPLVPFGVNDRAIKMLKDQFSYDTGEVRVITRNYYEPVKIIFNGPATIVFWADGTKTVVKCSENEPGYSEYTAVAYALAKKMFGNMSRFKRIVETVGEDKTKSVIKFKEPVKGLIKFVDM